MIPVVHTISPTTDKDCNAISTKEAHRVLHDELALGIQSMRNDPVYTLEEAWKEIDRS